MNRTTETITALDASLAPLRRRRDRRTRRVRRIEAQRSVRTVAIVVVREHGEDLFKVSCRACCVTHGALGVGVHPATWTRRLLNSMKKSTDSRWSQIVSTVKKSTASRLRLPLVESTLSALRLTTPARRGYVRSQVRGEKW